MNIKKYVEKVRLKEIFDPVMRFQIGNGFKFKMILDNYIDDSKSGNYAALLEWQNPEYQ